MKRSWQSANPHADGCWEGIADSGAAAPPPAPGPAVPPRQRQQQQHSLLGPPGVPRDPYMEKLRLEAALREAQAEAEAAQQPWGFDWQQQQQHHHHHHHHHRPSVVGGRVVRQQQQNHHHHHPPPTADPGMHPSRLPAGMRGGDPDREEQQQPQQQQGGRDEGGDGGDGGANVGGSGDSHSLVAEPPGAGVIPPFDPFQPAVLHGGPAVRDAGLSTVLIANLPVKRASEALLIRIMSPHGAISGVDIDMPVDSLHAAEDHQTTCEAFVTFLDPADARSAVGAVTGRDMSGVKLKLTLTGGFPKNGVIRHVRPEHCAGALKASETLRRHVERTHLNSGGTAGGTPASAFKLLSVDVAECASRIPTLQRSLIDAAALYIVEQGPAFEEALSMSEAANPAFNFLRPPHASAGGGALKGCVGATSHTLSYNAERLYYLWRVHALLQGDGLETWRTEPFQMHENGPIWLPPPQQGMERKRVLDVLTDDEKEELHVLVSRLDGSRSAVRDAMVWCIDRSACAREVVGRLEACIVKDRAGSPEVLIRRLHLISDILSNSRSKANRLAHRYIALFLAALPKAFTCLRQAAATDRLLAVDLESLLAAWRCWGLFTEAFLLTLRRNAGLC